MHMPDTNATYSLSLQQPTCLQDPFGAGMRISTRYAYRGGRLCATISIPNPASGTIFGMYLIDIHPKGGLHA